MKPLCCCNPAVWYQCFFFSILVMFTKLATMFSTISATFADIWHKWEIWDNYYIPNEILFPAFYKKRIPRFFFSLSYACNKLECNMIEMDLFDILMSTIKQKYFSTCLYIWNKVELLGKNIVMTFPVRDINTACPPLPDFQTIAVERFLPSLVKHNKQQWISVYV